MHVQTTRDYLTAFKRFSGFETEYVHVTQDALIGVDFGPYDVVFHSYCAPLCFEGFVSKSYRDRLRAFRGVKVLAVQDEYDRTDTLKAAIKDLGFDIVLTCVPQDVLEYVYPRSEFPDVSFITVLTGYVPESLAAGSAPRPLAERPIFIGYRGRDIGGRYGRLGFDKFEIGRRMKDICDQKGIATDIAMDEGSRIYGTAWFDFIGDCRAMLGSESGSNVFDFDGSIEARFKEMTAASGGKPPSYADFLPIVADRDQEINMGQISPRVFECALMHTPMILFTGRYSDAIAPDEHYIALEKDFSNVDEVLKRLTDIPALETMARRAFDHLVGSGRFTYRAFYADVASAIKERLGQRIPAGERIAPPVPSPHPALDASGAIIERPTPEPLGGGHYALRLDGREAVVFARERIALVEEFARLRSLFVAEIDRQIGSYEVVLNRLHTTIGRENARRDPWSAAKSDLHDLSVAFDAEQVLMSHERDAARAALATALAEGIEKASASAMQHLLLLEKGDYARGVEWIRRLNEAYQASGARLEPTFHEQLAAFRADLLPRLPLREQVSAWNVLIGSRLRDLKLQLSSRLAAASIIPVIAKRVGRLLRRQGPT